MYSTLSTLNTMTEVPVSKAPNPNCSPGAAAVWLPTAPGVCSQCVCVCVFVCSLLCVHFGWVKCRAQIPSMGHHTWSYVTSHFSFFLLIKSDSKDYIVSQDFYFE